MRLLGPLGVLFFCLALTSAAQFCADNEAPSAPGSLEVSGNSGSILIEWDAATDSPSCSGIDYYVVYRDNVWLGNTSDLDFVDGANLGEGEYVYTVHAVDLVGKNAGASVKNVIKVNSGGGSSGGSRGSGFVCEVDWRCGDWSYCVDGFMVRECIDMNNCRTSYLKPSVLDSCGVEEISFDEEEVGPGSSEEEGFFSAMTGAVVGGGPVVWGGLIGLGLIVVGGLVFLVGKRRKNRV